jgi:hypothetical protein
MNKVWQKPKLIILYRGRPEESVLASCKAGIAGPASGPVSNKNTDCIKAQCSATCDTVLST